MLDNSWKKEEKNYSIRFFGLAMSSKTAHETCEDIIKKVCDSKLNYIINQTPYSVYLTIRKKYAYFLRIVR